MSNNDYKDGYSGKPRDIYSLGASEYYRGKADAERDAASAWNTSGNDQFNASPQNSNGPTSTGGYVSTGGEAKWVVAVILVFAVVIGLAVYAGDKSRKSNLNSRKRTTTYASNSTKKDRYAPLSPAPILLTNGCRHPLRVVVDVFTKSGERRTFGWMTVRPGRSRYFQDRDGRRVTSTSGGIFYFAECVSGCDFRFGGGFQGRVGERKLGMGFRRRQKNSGSGSGSNSRFILHFQCR